jgi:hypothetical protein
MEDVTMGDNKPDAGVVDETEVDLNEDTTSTDSASDETTTEDESTTSKKVEGEDEVDLASILEDAGLDPKDPAAVKEAIAAMSEISSKVGNQDGLEKLLADAKELKDTKTAWAVQEELDKRAKETAEETIARLDDENIERERARKDAEAKANRSVEAQKAVEFFDKTAEKEIDSAKDVPDIAKPLLKKLLSSQNRLTDVDLNDSAEVKKLVAEQSEMVAKFVTEVIQQYADGKMEVPIVGKSTGSTKVQEKPKTLEEAKARTKAVTWLMEPYYQKFRIC